MATATINHGTKFASPISVFVEFTLGVQSTNEFRHILLFSHYSPHANRKRRQANHDNNRRRESACVSVSAIVCDNFSTFHLSPSNKRPVIRSGNIYKKKETSLSPDEYSKDLETVSTSATA